MFTNIPCPKGFTLTYYSIRLVAGPHGLVLPAYKGATFRGGFAGTFRRLVCGLGRQECKSCPAKRNCPYALVFESEPPPGAAALHKYESIPRPFLLEPPLEEKQVYAPGEALTFRLVLIGVAAKLLPYFVVTLDECARLGIGRGRRPFALDEIAAVNPLTGERAVIYQGADRVVRPAELAVTAEAVWARAAEEAGAADASGLRITFVTPTRITYEGQSTRSPEFHTLVRNLLRRVSSLCYFYHGFAYKADFPAIIRRAEAVSLVEDRTHWHCWERYSSRQKKRIPAEGFVGEAVYRGPIREFVPLLRLGELIHLGKGTVFGQGKFLGKIQGI